MPSAGTTHRGAPSSTVANEAEPELANPTEIVRTTITAIMASAIPATESRNRSGRRAMLAIANRSSRAPVLPAGITETAACCSASRVSCSPRGPGVPDTAASTADIVARFMSRGESQRIKDIQAVTQLYPTDETVVTLLRDTELPCFLG